MNSLVLGIIWQASILMPPLSNLGHDSPRKKKGGRERERERIKFVDVRL
jgi:hypothetical protein